MGHVSWNMEDSSTENNLDYDDCIVSLQWSLLWRSIMKRNKLSKENYKVQLVEKKKCTRKYQQIKEKPDSKWSTENANLKARCHPAKLPTYKKELKKSLWLGTVVHRLFIPDIRRQRMADL